MKVDASDYAMEGVLSMEFEDGKQRLVALTEVKQKRDYARVQQELCNTSP